MVGEINHAAQIGRCGGPVPGREHTARNNVKFMCTNTDYQPTTYCTPSHPKGRNGEKTNIQTIGTENIGGLYRWLEKTNLFKAKEGGAGVGGGADSQSPLLLEKVSLLRQNGSKECKSGSGSERDE